jgi:hypothetical protein
MNYYSDQQLTELTSLVFNELEGGWDSILQYALDIQGTDERGQHYKDIDGNSIHGMPDVATWYLKMFHFGDDTHPVVANKFTNSILALEKIQGIQWSFLVFVSPNSRLPTHIDNENSPPYSPSPFRNVLLSVKTPSENTDLLNVTIDNVLFGQKTGTALIFDANIPHSGTNNTDDWWIALVVVVDKSYWGSK